MPRFTKKSHNKNSGVNYLYSSGTDDLVTAKNSRNSLTLFGKNDSKKPQLSNTIRPDNLIAHWKLNEGTGTSIGDSRGGGYTGTMVSSSWVNGRKGKCLDFDGTNSHITTNLSITNTNTMTFSVWCNFNTDANSADAPQQYDGIIVARNGYNNSNSPLSGLIVTRGYPDPIMGYAWNVGGSTLSWTGGPKIDVGQWTHFVLVITPSKALFYKNGIFDSERVASHAVLNFNNPIIGRVFANGVWKGFDGKMSDIHIYNTDLTDKEIYKLYKAEALYLNIDTETGTIESNLMVWWKLNEGIGSKIYDYSVNDNVGTFGGSPTWVSKDISDDGFCLDFDGIDDHITTNLSISSINTISISVWLYIHTSADREGIILANENDLGTTAAGLLITSNGTRVGYTWGTRTVDNFVSMDIDYNRWTHFLVVITPSQAICYKNSNQYVTMSGAGHAALNFNNPVIGRSTVSGSTRFFDGKMSDIRIYNKALSVTEISAIFHKGMSKHDIDTLNVQEPSSVYPIDTRFFNSEHGITDMEGGLITQTKSVVHENLVLWWKMDEGVGTLALDSSGYGNNGNLIGTPTWTIDKEMGMCLDLNGSSQYIKSVSTIPIETLGIYDKITMCMWVKSDTENWDDADSFFGNNSLMNVRKTNGSKAIDMFVYKTSIKSQGPNYSSSSSGVSTVSISPTNITDWHFYVAVFDGRLSGKSLRLYFDSHGVVYGGHSDPQTLYSFNDYIYVGTSQGLGYVNGKVADYRIYNTALSADEIAQIYNEKRSQFYAPIPKDALVGHWKLNDGVGTNIHDYSNNGNDGTMSSSPVWVNTTHGTVLDFDGTDDYVEIANDSALNISGKEITISMWFNADDITSVFLLGKHYSFNSYDYRINIKSNSELEFRLFSTTLTSNLGLVQSRWYHIVCVYNGTNMYMYLDGIEKKSQAYTSQIFNNNNVLRIGTRHNGAQCFEGKISDVRLYNIALNAPQVEELYLNQRLKYFEPSPKLLQELETTPELRDQDLLIHYTGQDNSSGTYVTDYSGKRHHATVNNVTYSTTQSIEAGSYSLSFDGTGDYLEADGGLNNSLAFRGLNNSNPRTFTAWVYTTNLSVIRPIISMGNMVNKGYLDVYIDTDERLVVSNSSTGLTNNIKFNTPISVNAWNHISVVYDTENNINDIHEGSLKCYRDTLIVGTVSTSATGLHGAALTTTNPVHAYEKNTGDLGNANIIFKIPDGTNATPNLLAVFAGASNGWSATPKAGDTHLIQVYDASGGLSKTTVATIKRFYAESISTLTAPHSSISSYDAIEISSGTNIHASTLVIEYNENILNASYQNANSDIITINTSPSRDYIYSVTDEDLTTNLVGHWRINEGTETTINDSSVYGNNGTLTNTGTSVWVGSDIYGLSVDLDGTDDYIDIGNTGRTMKTISFWIYADDITTRNIIDLNGTSYITLHSNSTVNYTGGTWTSLIEYINGSRSTSAITASKWYHIAATITNGISVSDLDIGRKGTSNEFDGRINDVRIYSSVLSDNQIAALYHSSYHVYQQMEASLVGHWLLDEGTGTTAYDRASSNNGTLDNMTPSTDWVTGKDGEGFCLDFDGTNDRVSIPDSSGICSGIISSDTFSISAWFNLETNNYARAIIGTTPGSGSGFTLWADGYHKRIVLYSWEANTGVYSDNQVITLGKWHHVVATTNISVQNLYLDGVLIKTASNHWNFSVTMSSYIYIGYTSFIHWFDGKISDVRIYNTALNAEQIKAIYSSTGGNLRIGKGAVGSYVESNEFNGYMDDIRLYNRALSLDEIKGIWNSGSGTYSYLTPTQNTIAKYNFSTGTGTTAYDNSGNNVNMTLEDASLWTKITKTGLYGLTFDEDTVHCAYFDPASNTSALSLSTWISVETMHNNTIIGSKAAGSSLANGDFQLTVGPKKSANLVGWWLLDEGTGTTVNDRSGNGNNGTMTNMDASTDWVGGMGRACLDFDGSNDYVDIGNAGITMKTISFWIYADDITTRNIIDLNGTSYITLHSDSTVNYTGGTWTSLIEYINGSQSTSTIIASKWYHIAATITNGISVSDLDIGRKGTSNEFDGKISDVRIYNTVLTAEEIYAIYNESHQEYVSLNVKLGGTETVIEAQKPLTISNYNTRLWYHVAFNYISGSLMELYINGEREAFTNITTSQNINLTNNVYLGSRNLNGSKSNYFDGKLCDLRLYSKPLKETEIKQIYNGMYECVFKLAGINPKTAETTIENTPVLDLATKSVGISGSSPTLVGLKTDTMVDGRYGKEFSVSNSTITYSGTEASNEGGQQFIRLGDENYLSKHINRVFTITGWIKYDGITSGDEHYIFGKYKDIGTATSHTELDYYKITVDPSIEGFAELKFMVCSGGGSVSTTGTMGYGVYHHIACVCNGENQDISIYINGTYKNSKTITTFDALNSYGIDIGRPYNTSWDTTNRQYYFAGSVCDIRFYETALSQETIQKMMYQGSGNIISTKMLTAPTHEPDLRNGLIFHFTGNQTTGTTALDISGNGNNGTLINMENADWVEGKYGRALDFDGTNEYIDIGNAGITMRTISFWIYADDITTINIIDLNGISYIAINSDSTINYTGGTWTNLVEYINGIASTSAIAASKWYHIAATITNGISVSDLDIGRYSEMYFDGKIDDVRIYDRVLSAEEVSLLYNNTLENVTKNNIKMHGENRVGAPQYISKYTIDNRGNTIVPLVEIARDNLVVHYDFERHNGTTIFDRSNQKKPKRIYNNPSLTGSRDKALSGSGSNSIKLSNRHARNRAETDAGQPNDRFNNRLIKMMSSGKTAKITDYTGGDSNQEAAATVGTVSAGDIYMLDYKLEGEPSNGTVQNAGSIVNGGKYGTKCLKLNGSSEYLSISTTNNDLDMSGSWTVSIWVKVNEIPASNDMFIWAKTNNINYTTSYAKLIMIDNSDNDYIKFMYNNATTLSSNYSIELNKWTHIVVSKGWKFLNANMVSIYVNGKLCSRSQISMSSIAANHTLEIGRGYNGSTYYYSNSHVDDFRFYDTMLNDHEIYKLYLNETKVGPLIHYSFEEGIREPNIPVSFNSKRTGIVLTSATGLHGSALTTTNPVHAYELSSGSLGNANATFKVADGSNATPNLVAVFAGASNGWDSIPKSGDTHLVTVIPRESTGNSPKTTLTTLKRVYSEDISALTTPHNLIAAGDAIEISSGTNLHATTLVLEYNADIFETAHVNTSDDIIIIRKVNNIIPDLGTQNSNLKLYNNAITTSSESYVGNYSLLLEQVGTSDYGRTYFEGVLGSNPRTISFWFKRLNTSDIGSNWHYLVDYGDAVDTQRFSIALAKRNSTNSAFLVVSNKTSDSSGVGGGVYGSSIQDTRWHHCVVVLLPTYSRMDGLRLYLDGVDDTKTAINTHSLITTTKSSSSTLDWLTIGGNSSQSAGGNGFTGYIDDFRMYNVALTEDEIRMLYYNSGNVKYVNLEDGNSSHRNIITGL